jgi:hypothetical protein
MAIQINGAGDNKYKESESISINLETLREEYKNLLIQYKQAVLNYINYLREESMSPSHSRSVTAVNGQAFWGTSGLSQLSTSSIQECEAACSNNPKCSGATFNSKKNACWLRSGNSSAFPSSQDDTAILPKGKYLLTIIEGINKKLISVNDKILVIVNNNHGLYDVQDENRDINTNILIQNYSSLEAERAKIERMLKEYKDIDTTQKDTELVLTKNYYTYILLFALVILVCILLLKFTVQANFQFTMPSINLPEFEFVGELGKNAYYIVFSIIVISIIVHFYYKNFGL